MARALRPRCSRQAESQQEEPEQQIRTGHSGGLQFACGEDCSVLRRARVEFRVGQDRAPSDKGEGDRGSWPHGLQRLLLGRGSTGERLCFLRRSHHYSFRHALFLTRNPSTLVSRGKTTPLSTRGPGPRRPSTTAGRSLRTIQYSPPSTPFSRTRSSRSRSLSISSAAQM